MATFDPMRNDRVLHGAGSEDYTATKAGAGTNARSVVMERETSENVENDIGHSNRGKLYPSSQFPAAAGKVQLSESVAMHLRARIFSGKLAPGEFLRIDAIASELGVSSTPVREGLLLLQSESIVRLIPRRGFIVVGLNRDELLDLFWAQATIAAELAARAAQRTNAREIAAARDLHDQHQRAAAAGEHALAARLGFEFHRKINHAAQAPRLAQLLGNLTKQLPNRLYASIEGQVKEAVDYHTIILDAISIRDSESARSLMYRHILKAGEHLIALLERQGIWGEPEMRQETGTSAPDLGKTE